MLGLVLDAVILIAALIWAGGLLVLGALVAPTVFRSGTPHAAELMQAIFSRFDRIAIAATAMILLGEGISWLSRQPMRRNDRTVRLVIVVVLAACATAQAMYLTPTIIRLFSQGARRGIGEMGATFDRVHRISEWVGRVTVFSALALAAFVIRSRGAQDEIDDDAGFDDDERP